MEFRAEGCGCPVLRFLDRSPRSWFERVSMLVILLNCVTLGMFHPCEDIACDSPRCRILQVLSCAVRALRLRSGLCRLPPSPLCFFCRALMTSSLPSSPWR